MTALPERPPLSSLICTFALLGQDPDGLESALILAEAGLLAGIVSMADTASTAPADNVIQFLHLPASLKACPGVRQKAGEQRSGPGHQFGRAGKAAYQRASGWTFHMVDSELGGKLEERYCGNTEAGTWRHPWRQGS